MKINDFNLEISEISFVSNSFNRVHSLMLMIYLNRSSNRAEWFIPDFILKSRTSTFLSRISIDSLLKEFITEKIHYENLRF